MEGQVGFDVRVRRETQFVNDVGATDEGVAVCETAADIGAQALRAV